MIVEVLSLLASIALICWSCATHQDRVDCPPGTWLPEGVRDGWVTCRPKPIGIDERNARGILVDHSVQPPGFIETRLFCCPSGPQQYHQDGSSAWCSRD